MFPRYFLLLLEKRSWTSERSVLYWEGDCSQGPWLLVAKIPTGSDAFFKMFSINPTRALVPAHHQTHLKAEHDERVLLNEGWYLCLALRHLLTGCSVSYQKHPHVLCTSIASRSCLIVLKINNNDINDLPYNTHWQQHCRGNGTLALDSFIFSCKSNQTYFKNWHWYYEAHLNCLLRVILGHVRPRTQWADGHILGSRVLQMGALGASEWCQT